MLFPYFNSVLGVLGALNFWPLTIYFPMKMYFKQKKIRAWTAYWILVQAFSCFCLLLTVVGFIGSLEELIIAKTSWEWIINSFVGLAHSLASNNMLYVAYLVPQVTQAWKNITFLESPGGNRYQRMETVLQTRHNNSTISTVKVPNIIYFALQDTEQEQYGVYGYFNELN